MATIEIFVGSKKDSTKLFHRSFYILQDYSSDKLIWHSGEEEAKAGIWKVWVQCADTAPKIAFVLPDWQLIIDGELLEQKIYEDVENLAGKLVELLYGDYRFVFQF